MKVRFPVLVPLANFTQLPQYLSLSTVYEIDMNTTSEVSSPVNPGKNPEMQDKNLYFCTANSCYNVPQRNSL